MRCLAISNTFPPDYVGGYELGAERLLVELEASQGWVVDRVGGVRDAELGSLQKMRAVLPGFFPQGVSGAWEDMKHAFKHRARPLGFPSEVDLAEYDLALMFNPRRLMLTDWVPLLAGKLPVIPLISDYWPRDYPYQDKFWERFEKAWWSSLPPFAGLKRRYEHCLLNSVLKFSQGAVFTSRFLEEDLRDAVHTGKDPAVIHWGVDTEVFCFELLNEERLNHWGFCGRATPEKGLHLALDAFKQVAGTRPKLQFWIASDLSTRYGQKIFERIVSDSLLSKRVQCLGHETHEELHRHFYTKVGVLIFPSLWPEPFSLTLLEAQASGCVVIASETGGTTEWMEPELGWTFDADEALTLTLACGQVLEASQEQLQAKANAARAKVEAKTTWPSMARRLDDYARNCLAGS